VTDRQRLRSACSIPRQTRWSLANSERIIARKMPPRWWSPSVASSPASGDNKIGFLPTRGVLVQDFRIGPRQLEVSGRNAIFICDVTSRQICRLWLLNFALRIHLSHPLPPDVSGLECANQGRYIILSYHAISLTHHVFRTTGTRWQLRSGRQYGLSSRFSKGSN
jgi:hypothetical protein